MPEVSQDQASDTLANTLALDAWAVATRESAFERRTQAAREESAARGSLRGRHNADDSVETDAGTEPITILGLEAGASDWLSARGFHPGSAPKGAIERPKTRLEPAFVRSLASSYLR